MPQPTAPTNHQQPTTDELFAAALNARSAAIQAIRAERDSLPKYATPQITEEQLRRLSQLANMAVALNY